MDNQVPLSVLPGSVILDLYERMNSAPETLGRFKGREKEIEEEYHKRVGKIRNRFSVL